MPRTIEQYEQIRERRKKQIMDAALELIAKDGYQNVSISKIAQKARISKGLLYNYFESKEDLILSILNKGMDEMVAPFDPDQDGVLTDEEFKYFVTQVFGIIKTKHKFYKLYFSLFIQPAVYKLIKDKFEALLGKLFAELIHYYERKGSPNPEAEAYMFGALLDGIAFNYVLNPKIYPLDQVIDLVIEKFSYNTTNK
jgi:AcrR family transcriptional regulator